MAQTVVLSSVTQSSGKYYVNFSDGTSFEFNSLAELQAWARLPDTDRSLTQQMCVAYALARSSDLSNIQSVKDKNFTFDLTNNSPVRIQ